jgi:hypothetical protein
VKFPCNLVVFGYLLGDGGGEFWAIIGLNGGWGKWGIISWIRMVAMVMAHLFEVGKASNHPKVSVRTRRYLCHLMGGI